MLTSYKYGWKTVYYQNTMDGKTEDEVEATPEVDLSYLNNPSLITQAEEELEDEGCDSGACAI